MANTPSGKPLGGLARAFAALRGRLYTPPDNNIAGVSPQAWPSALQPVQGTAPKGSQPLSFSYWNGINQEITPRADTPLTFANLRDLGCYSLARICIENVKDVLTTLPWKIQLKRGPGEDIAEWKKRQEKDKVAQALTEFWNYPDGVTPWGDWWRPVLDDLLVIDAPAFLVDRTLDGKVARLRWSDGSQFLRLIDDQGNTPQGDSPAYTQLWEGMPRLLLTTRQLVYRPSNIVPRNSYASKLYGMCYSDDTEILTRDRSWVRFADLQQSDLVATRSKAKQFEWQKPTAYINEPYAGEMYAFKSNALDILVTPNHRMLVGIDGSKGINETVMTARELATNWNRGRKLACVSEWAGTEIGTVTFPYHRNGSVEMAGDDYCALMGAYLAEGNIRCQGGVEIAQLRTSKAFDLYSALIKRINGNGKDGHNGKAFAIGRRALTAYFKQFGLAHDKFVPQSIKNSSPRQLRIFWEHYFHGDGSFHYRESKSGRGTRVRRDSATTVSKRLADDLVEIAQKLGWSASVAHEIGGNVRQFPAGHASICRGRYLVKTRYSKYASARPQKVQYLGSVHCVSVPNGFVYVRRNGMPVWSGNSITEQLAEDIEIGQQRLNFILAYYTSGSIPNILHLVPPGITPDKINETMQWMDSELSGNLAARRKYRMMQGFSDEGKDQVLQLKEPVMADLFDDVHIKKVTFGYGVSSQRLTKMLNRAGAEAGQDAAEKEGIMPRLLWMKRTVDYTIQRQQDQPNYELVFDTDDELDAVKQATVDGDNVKVGLRTIDETRIDRGLVPFGLPETQQPIVITATGVQPLEGSFDRINQQVANDTAAANKPAPQPVAMPGKKAVNDWYARY